MKSNYIRHTAMLSFLIAIIAIGKLSAHEGHDHPSLTPQPSNTTASIPATETMPEQMPMDMPMNMVEDFPNYHPLIVHFPVVLLIFAAFFQILSFVMYRKEFSMATLLLLLAGTVSVWLASNIFHAHAMNLPAHVNEIFETHELMAKYTWWLSLAALLAKSVSHFFTTRKWWSEVVVLFLLIGASITVSIAGHHGAQLVHMGGVGPQGKYLESH